MTDLSSIQQALGDAARSLIDGLLADLGPNQHTRLLRLHTPLGPDILLAERAQITEAIGPGHSLLPLAVQAHAPSTGYAIDLLALSTHASLNPEDLIGQPVLLELLTSQSVEDLRPFHGHVTALELLGADGGYARYRLRIEPWTAFLAHRTDSWVFQNQSVLDITETLFADYAAQGALAPQWRIDVADRTVYAKRSLCTQFNETDLAFLQRIWAEEGLFTWYEHKADTSDSTSLGQHTLVIADHNGAFLPNAQASIRYTQSSSAMKEDSITQWHGTRRMGSTTLNTGSFDYRLVGNTLASASSDAAHAQPIALVHSDQPGAYAYEDASQAQRLATVQQQALDAARKRFEGLGTVRTLAPATTFSLCEHAEHDAGVLSGIQGEATFVVLSVVHTARNNISADAKAGLQHLLGEAILGKKDVQRGANGLANAGEEPLYQARLTAQRANVPVRSPLTDSSGRIMSAKPTVHGTQTALVVGLSEPVHTDRDGRIKIQFHWQRGANSSHRLGHTTSASDADNAPASDASGTWVRVAQQWAGANWGGVLMPRLGQELVVAFIEGDIDRPVVVGGAYNGQGSEDAQGNVVAGGAANATGNAPAWFAGGQRQGDNEGHAHAAVLSGFKSQSLDASSTGGGGYNQLVFDDSPGQGRVLAHTTQSQTWLQMGHLLQQDDNQRLAPRGLGLELHTQALGALRAGSGLHVSTHAKAGGTSSSQGQPTNTREAQSQLQSHAELVNALSTNAQTQLAKLPDEPAPDQLNAQQALQSTLQSLKGVQSSEPADDSGNVATDGGHGSIPAPLRPDIVLSSAADIASATPVHTVMAVGQHTTVTSGQDTNVLGQRHVAWSVMNGISLFTRGQAKDGQRAVQDVGMKLHAASGNVNVQAQTDGFTLTAAKAIDLQSTGADITISAPQTLMLNGGGGYIKLSGGDIEIGTGGNASFMASMKELGPGGSATAAAPPLSAPKGMFNEAFTIKDEDSGAVIAHARYRVEDAQGNVVASGMTDERGRTGRVHTSSPDQIRIFLLD